MERENIHLDAILAIKEHGWKFVQPHKESDLKILVPPFNDERRFWTAMWNEFGYPHWLPRYSEGKEF